MLEEAGERVHPASAWLANESAHIEAESGEHDLHVFQALREMDEILVNNFMVFNDVVEETPYDLVIGDEAWDVDYFLHENPELKRFSFVWMTDFVGYLPMPDLGEREAFLTADYNAEMLEQRARFKRIRDRQVFVGNPEDVVDESFGPGLPNIREWTVENFEFAGYVTGFEPPSEDEVAAVAPRARVRRCRRAVHRHRRRIRRRRAAPAPGAGRRSDRQGARARAALPRRDRPEDRPGRAALRRGCRRAGFRSRTSTCAWPRPMWPWSRAG